MVLLLMTFSSCSKDPIEVRHKPDIVTPDQWSIAQMNDEEIRAEWWESFKDKRLDGMVVEALENNYDLKAASARVLAAAMQARITGADLLPSVGAGWTGRGQRQNFIGLPIPGAEDRVLSRTFKSSGVSLDVSWEADLWGKLSARKKAAISDYEAAEAELWAATLSLVAQTSKAWFSVLEGRQQVELAKRTVSSYKTTAERIRGRYSSGLQSSLDLRLALSSLDGAEALLQQRQDQLGRGIRQLEILLGQYPAAAIQPSDELPEVPPMPPAGFPSELVSRRPDLIAAEKRMWAAGARWTEARRALYPSFNISGGIGTSTSDFLQVFNGNFFIWNVAGSILQPVFQGGRLRAQIELRDAQSREAAAIWSTAVLRAFAEVESALAAESFLAQQETELVSAMQQSKASWELAEDRYNSGLEPFITVLESQRRSLQAESALLNVRRERLDARIDLHLALGGGFKFRDQEGETKERNKEGNS